MINKSSFIKLPDVPGVSPIFGANLEKDGGLTIAAALAALGAFAKLLDQISGGAKDLEELIKRMSSSIQDIRRTVSRIETLLDRLPLVIDRTVEAKFTQYLDSELRALVQMYLEVKASLTEGEEITPEISDRIAYIHNQVSAKSRTIMAYGISAGTVLALTAGLEDDCASLRKHSPAYRRQSIRTIENFFARMLGTAGETPPEDSVNGFLATQADLLSKLDTYIGYLDKDFVGSQRQWSSSWECRIEGYKNNKVKKCKRINYTATIIGSSLEGYKYQEISSSESYSEVIGEASRFVAVSEFESDPSDQFLVADRTLFRESLAAQRSDVEYANSILAFKKDQLETKAQVESLKEIFWIALQQSQNRFSALS